MATAITGLLSGYDGFILLPDSPSYISMQTFREPVYCIFLAILRAFFGLFGETSDLYLTAAVYIQSLLAAYAAWCLANYLGKELILTRFQTSVIVFIPMAISLMLRFVNKDAYMFSNAILTEGITCSLFLLFIRYLLEVHYRKSLRSLLAATVLSFVMIATRKQMYVTLILLVIVICWTYLEKREIRKGILITFVCAGGILCANTMLDHGYNYLIHRESGTHSSDNRFMATMVIYTSERSYGEQITDQEARDLFYEIYNICEAQGYLKHSVAGEGWHGRVTHFTNNYDLIQLRSMWPTIREYVYENYEGGEVYLEQKVDEITNRMIMSLLPKVWSSIIGSFIDNFIYGLITTAAQTPTKSFLIICAAIAYILCAALLLIHIRYEGMTKVAFLAICTIFSIVINVAVVSMVIFAQARYTIYNMPILYITLWILFVKDCRLLIKSKSVV